MSTTPANRHNAPISVSEAFIDSTSKLTADEGSDYGDFGNDEEELEIVDRLLQQIASKEDERESFVVTDIEDYEPPRGVRLPKVLGLEQTRLWERPPSQSQKQLLRDFEGTSGKSAPSTAFLVLTLTRS
jgi:hypothetical protein